MSQEVHIFPLEEPFTNVSVHCLMFQMIVNIWVYSVHKADYQQFINSCL